MALSAPVVTHPRIVILGSQGFIFSHVTEYFLKKGWEVHGFDNLSAGSHPELVPVFEETDNFHFYEEDVSFASAVDKIVRIDPQYIIHAAAISDVDYSIKQPTKTLQANNNATINAFEAARRCKNLRKFLYVSTDEVYGECDHPKSEDELLFPRNPYAVSKAFGSLLRLSYDNTYPELRDRTVETRFCNVFGPRQDDRKIIPAIKQAMKTGKPLELHNKGMGVRQWIHVDDIPPVIDLLLERGHRTYNITTGAEASVIDLIALAERATGKKVPTIPGKRSGMDMKYLMNGDRMMRDFMWKPKVDPAGAAITYFNA